MGAGPSFPITKLSRDRVIVVTGASNGLGYEIAKWCAFMGATVILACRNEELTRKCIERMNEEFKWEKVNGRPDLADNETLNLQFLQVDLASFKSVINFTETYKKSGKPLHVLFHNAGTGFYYNKTEDGFESVLQVNYLSQFVITAKLLPVMKASGDDCRIFLMGSEVYQLAPFDLNSINYEGTPRQYRGIEYYGRSKIYGVMQMYSMIRRLQGTNITVNVVDPGNTRSNFTMPPGCIGCVLKCLKVCCATKTHEGAKCAIDCATNPKYKGETGLYYFNFNTKTTKAVTRNEENQEKLWELTFNMLKDFLNDQDRAIMEGQ